MNQETSVSRQAYDLPNEFVAPETTLEKKMVAIWQEFLEVRDLGIDDDFFDLGGNSKIAAKLVNRVNEVFGCSIKTGAVASNSTISMMVGLLGKDEGPGLPSNLIAIRETGSRPPLFLVHGAAGIVFPGPKFMSGFHDDQPVYAFQIRGFDGTDEPLDTVEQIAQDYTNSMLDVCPDGPWFIAGYCAGGWIAVEMARRLENSGRQVGRLVLIDPGVQRGKMREKFDTHHSLPARILRPIVPASILESMNLHSNWAKFRCFLATGHWTDYRETGAFDKPAVRDWILSRRKEHMQRAVRLGNIGKRAGREVSGDEGVTLDGTDAIIYASAKLKHAFFNYSNNSPLDMPVDLILSKSREKEMANTSHPLNTIFPMQNRIVTGENHVDAVASSSPTNSRIIQNMMDEISGFSAPKSLKTVA